MLELMHQLRSTMFCLKGSDGRYLAVNPTFVQRTLKRSQREVLGCRAGELFVPELAQRYEEQDHHVLQTGQPLHRELELIRAHHGPYEWHLTSKVPVMSDGRTTGLVSISEPVGDGSLPPDDETMRSLSRVVAHVEAHLGESLRVTELATVAAVSTDTLTRRVEKVFGRSPAQLILSMRIDRARSLLSGTSQSIAQIAVVTGFYDQAAFTRSFARVVGRTPGQYRRQSAGT